ncbi:MAG TPA: serine hydrolase domain-containing protein [Pseudolysinimonas sp.]|nr:serine hydrolase domain-containing protein [Pseudolysinimonas sp.]
MRSTPRVIGWALGAVAAVVVLGVVVAVVLAPAPMRAAAHRPVAATVARDAARAANKAKSDHAVATLVNATQPGCSAAVARHGRVVWAGAGGLADLVTKTPDTTSTRFDIASVSKQFTATAILILQRQGKLKLSDPIAKYVDGLPAWGATITLDQLMHHTSRIPDYWVELGKEGIGFTQAADEQTTLNAIRREKKLDPGTGYEYSNSNYVLLAEVVGRVSGTPLPTYLADHIFRPLGLAMVVAPTLQAPDVALSYDDDLNLQQSGWTAYGYSGIITTPSELARWGDQYRAGDIIQDDFAVGAVGDGTGDEDAAGIYIQPSGGLSHSGRIGGYISDFIVSPDRETVIAVMCNGHTSPRWGLADALRKIWGPTAGSGR